MIEAYGWVHEQFVSRLGADVPGIAIRSALRDHAVANGVVASGEAVLGFAARPGTIGMEEARALLQVGAPMARRLLGRAGRLPVGSRRSVRHAIDRRGVLSLAQRRGAGIGVAALGRRFGLCKHATRAIVATGILNELAMAGEVGTAPRFDDVRLAATILSLAPRLAAPRQGEELVRLSKAARIAGVDVATILRRVQTRNLTPTSWPDDGELAKATFRRADLVRAPSPATASGLTAVASQLGLHPDALRMLVDLGFIRGIKHPSGWYFKAGAIRSFQKDFVLATEIASRHRTTSACVVRRLALCDIRPVAAPPMCRQVVYRRCDLAAFAPEPLRTPS